MPRRRPRGRWRGPAGARRQSTASRPPDNEDRGRIKGRFTGPAHAADAFVVPYDPGATLQGIYRIDATGFFLLGLASTHAFSVPDALELGRALGRAPRRVVVIGVEGAAFGMGDPLTPAVEAALDGVAEAVLGELEAG